MTLSTNVMYISLYNQNNFYIIIFIHFCRIVLSPVSPQVIVLSPYFIMFILGSEETTFNLDSITALLYTLCTILQIYTCIFMTQYVHDCFSLYGHCYFAVCLKIMAGVYLFSTWSIILGKAGDNIPNGINDGGFVYAVLSLCHLGKHSICQGHSKYDKGVL